MFYSSKFCYKYVIYIKLVLEVYYIYRLVNFLRFGMVFLKLYL